MASKIEISIPAKVDSNKLATYQFQYNSVSRVAAEHYMTLRCSASGDVLPGSLRIFDCYDFSLSTPLDVGAAIQSGQCMAFYNGDW